METTFHPSLTAASTHLSAPAPSTARSASPSASHTYTTELPRPPRIPIPPPVPSTYSTAPTQSPATSSPSDSLLLFLSQLLPPPEWRYESRRTAQQLLPHLYLGPLPPARNTEFLRQNGITQAVAIRSYKTAGILKMANDPDPSWPVDRHVVDVGRSFNDMLTAFRKVKTLIDQHFLIRNPTLVPEDEEVDIAQTLVGLPREGIKGGKTLLYCESGNERSAACAVAYVMATFAVGTVSAVQYVQARRFCIGFSEDIKGLLVTYEGILQAQRECGGGVGGRVERIQQQQQQRQGQIGQYPAGRKRGSDEVYESEGEEMGRDGVAPFNGESQGDVDMDM